MNTAPIWLNVITLLIGLGVVGASLAHMMRTRRNRTIVKGALVGREGHESGDTADGAIYELLGFVVIAFVVMGLLGLGLALR